MTEFYTRKQIDNSRLIRPSSPGRLRECWRFVALGSVLTGAVLLYAWQHFQFIQFRYQFEQLKSERAQAVELNQQLKLEAAGLRSPMRIDVIARGQLGLVTPIPSQVGPAEVPTEAVLAQARSVQSSTAR